MRLRTLHGIIAPLRTSLFCPGPIRSTSLRSTQQARYASGGQHYNPPTGNLFGEKPGPRVKEAWEDIYMYGMFGGMALMTVLYLYKPDTTVQTWAMAEAMKKIEAEGGLPKYEKTG